MDVMTRFRQSLVRQPTRQVAQKVEMERCNVCGLPIVKGQRCPSCGYTGQGELTAMQMLVKSIAGGPLPAPAPQSFSQMIAKSQKSDGSFQVYLPIVKARKNGQGEMILTLECSGPEQDSDGDYMALEALERMAQDAPGLPFLDGHYQDALFSVLGTIQRAWLTGENHLAIDAVLDERNPFARRLYSEVTNGSVQHGASIRGLVNAADRVNGGQIFRDIQLLEISRTWAPAWRHGKAMEIRI